MQKALQYCLILPEKGQKGNKKEKDATGLIERRVHELERQELIRCMPGGLFAAAAEGRSREGLGCSRTQPPAATALSFSS